MARFLHVTNRETFGEVVLETLKERMTCDNDSCKFHSNEHYKLGIPDSNLPDVVVRGGKEFCSDACYLTFMAEAKTDPAPSTENNTPHVGHEKDKEFTSRPRPTDRRVGPQRPYPSR